MFYCPGCGSCYQEGDQVCKSCGCLLNGGAKLPGVEIRSGKKRTKTRGKKRGNYSHAAVPKQTGEPLKQAGTTKEQVTTAPEELTDARQLQSEVVNLTDEIHLGKGIIKPKAVERDLEGYHFKYEEQSRAVQKEALLKEQGAEVRAVNPEFTAELATEGADRSNTFNNRVNSHSETLKVIGNAYSFKAEAKPASGTAGPVPDVVLNSQTAPPAKTQETQAVQETQESGASDILTVAVSDDEIHDLETAWAEIRQAENDLLFEMETVAKSLEKNVKQTEPFDWEDVNRDDGGMNMAENVETIDNPTIITDNIQVEEAEPAKAGETAPGDLPILMQGQQSWCGIPLPYQYRLSERFLVCVEPNGRLFEYDLTKIKKVMVKQSWLGKFLGIGDVVLDFQHQVPSRYILTGIANPAKLRDLLEELLKNKV
jgi:transcription initiation factor TFIIIB Brf1 subunit/transcription initiation factor TFIIB